jgi:hypothetical protein
MKGKYRVYVLGEMPRGLRERISEIHASAILLSRKPDKTIQSLENKQSSVIIRNSSKVQ